MHGFLEVQHCHKEESIPLPFMDEVLDKVANHEIGSFLDEFLGYHQGKIVLEHHANTRFIND
jgi:hypothetical protein